MKNFISNYQKNRELLKSLSKKARLIRSTMIERAVAKENEREALYWESRTINDILFKVLYKKNNAQEFNTFHQWKAMNKTIKKGAKAAIIWGQPRTKTQEAEGKEIDEYSFFPLCYLFSNEQVTEN